MRDGKVVCKIDGCDKPAWTSQGYCAMHYYRIRRYGSLDRKKEDHGCHDSPEYKIWTAMKQRCFNPKCSWCGHYGGRGINVCDRWASSFSAFLSDIGKRPSSSMQLDRIDNDGNYEPENCRWATPAQNSRNTRHNVLDMEKAIQIRKLYARGDTTERAIAKRFGVSHGAIHAVLSGNAWNPAEQEKTA